MGRLKFSLITEPKFAHDAAAVFREMKQFEEVDLINSKAIADSEPRAMEKDVYKRQVFYYGNDPSDNRSEC